MGLYQRNSDGLWIVAWYEQGKKKTKAFRDEQTARSYEAERLNTMQGTTDRATLGELTALFFRSRPDFHPRTKKHIVTLLAGREDGGKHIEGAGEFLRDKYADTLSRQDLERLREGLRFRKAGNNTINKYQAYIRAILAWGADQELITRNPWRDFKRLPVKKAVISVRLNDIKSIVRVAPEWLQWAIMTTWSLSLRPGHIELFGLMWTAFDWERGIVHVRQGKSGRIKTVFPPRPYMEIAYKRYKEDMAAGFPWVCHRNGRKVHDYRTAWDRAIRDAGVPHMPMYSIRHAAASEMLARGADLAAVAAQLGHSTIATTSNFYAHVTSGSQQKAAALMPGLIDDE